MDRKPSLAEQFFEDCKNASDPLAHLHSFLADKTQESDWLDFKCHPGSEPKVKEMWYEALSGFANTGGGVLVWGVEAKKDADGVDAASALCPIRNPRTFESRLRELARHGTNPPLSRVTYHTVEDSAKGEGFVLCLIPESDFKPHRAEIAGKPQYFIRAGDSFQIPNPSLLRQLFYPRIQPRLWVEACLRAGTIEKGSEAGKFEMECSIQVNNDGPGTAENCVVMLEANQQAKVRAEKVDSQWGGISAPNVPFAWRTSHAIHPGLAVPLCSLQWVAEVANVYSSDHRNRPSIGEALIVTLLLYARDTPPQKIAVGFSRDLFRTGYCHWARGYAEPVDE